MADKTPFVFGAEHKIGDTTASASGVDGTTLKFTPPRGYYDGTNDKVVKADANFAAANIKSGTSIFGVTGTLAASSPGIPVTGQTSPYDLYYRDDGAIQAGLGRSGRFTDNGNNTISDSVTGLMWIKDIPSLGGNWGSGSTPFTLNTWQDALNEIDTLCTSWYAGYGDWRMPNVFELVTLCNMALYDPALNGTYFLNIPVGGYTGYFSSTTCANDAAYSYWTVCLHSMEAYNGGFYGGNKTSAAYCLVVRGGNTL